MNIVERWNAYWFRPGYLLHLSIARIAAVLMQLVMLVQADVLKGLRTLAAAPDAMYDPLAVLHLMVWPFGWEYRPTLVVMESAYWVTLVVGFIALVGIKTNLNLFIFALGNIFLQAYLYSFGDIHHPQALMMIALFIFAFSPSGAVFSWDGRTRSVSDVSPFARWPLLLVQWLFAWIYFSSAYCKLKASGLEWLNGFTLRYYLLQDGLRWGSDLGIWMSSEHVLAVIISFMTVIFEATFFLAVLFPALALIYIPMGIALHTGIYITMKAPFFQYFALYCAFIPWIPAAKRLRHSGIAAFGILVLLFAFSGTQAEAQATGRTYYISPGGNDSNRGTREQPWRTFEKAIKDGMDGGDTLILRDGIYRQSIGTHFSNKPYASYSPPSGSPSAYTVIRAEHDGRAIIADGGIYLGNAVYDGLARGSSYIQIEGLKLKHSSIEMRNSHHIKILRVGIKNGLSIGARYGQVIRIADRSHHVLLEDVWVVGTMRYGINVYESNRVILRRVVVRFDGNTEREPKAGINFYGATDRIKKTSDCMAQNCILLDFNPGRSLDAGMQNVHAAENIKYYGCIALNLPCHGFFLNEKFPAGGNDVINSVVWDVDEAGIAMKSGDPARTTLIDQVTVGYSRQGVAQWKRLNGKNVHSIIQKSLFLNNLYPNEGIDTALDNIYIPSRHAQGESYGTKDPHLETIIQTTDTGTGIDGAKRGAVILKRYGVSGTLWGEPGFDSLTDVDLWPWPNEERIHADFSERDEYRTPTSDWKGRAYTIVNDPERGFAAPGQTLTRYIWNYLKREGP